MTSGFDKSLDGLVNKFHQYGLVRYRDDSEKRNEIIYLYNMKEHWKNETKDDEGKVPTYDDIMHCIMYLRWEKILPI